MAARSRARGTVAAVGLFLLFAGLVGGGVLYVVSQQRPSDSVEGFARAPIGCTTTMEFSEVGTFFVFEEAGATFEPVEGGCQPVATPGATFGAQFTGDRVPDALSQTGEIDYDVDGFAGRSVQRVEITEPGEYAVAVIGSDLTVVAALGRDPNEGVDDLRRTALAVATGGIVLGLGLLIFAGRRSKRAATLASPDGPGWGPARPRTDGNWPPEPPRLGQVPVNPHLPNEPASVTRPAPPLPERSPSVSSPWDAPSGSAEPLAPPDPTTVTRAPSAPEIEPTLPDAPGKTSGT
ncbi:MAG: hypothetical protein ABIP17_08500 [Ilumatobacteraceae bacterium]